MGMVFGFFGMIIIILSIIWIVIYSFDSDWEVAIGGIPFMIIGLIVFSIGIEWEAGDTEDRTVAIAMEEIEESSVIVLEVRNTTDWVEFSVDEVLCTATYRLTQEEDDPIFLLGSTLRCADDSFDMSHLPMLTDK